MPVRLILFGLLVLAPPVMAQQKTKPGREPTDEAIDRGLRYLAQSQSANGSWPPTAPPNYVNRRAGELAVTSLAVMAFLSAGHVPGEGPYKDVVDRGVRFVLSAPAPNGLIAPPLGGNHEMYVHGIATLMLAEVSGMTSGQLADEVRDRLGAAVKVILQAQRKGDHRDSGGWRYNVTGFDSDLSVTGWQLLALRAAKSVGCDVPAERIEAAVEYIRRCHDPRTGGYAYTVGGEVTVPCTGTGILALELCRKEYHKSPEAVRAATYLLKNTPSPDQRTFYYGVYYTSQAMFQMGETLGTDYWKSHREELHRSLLRSNTQQANGAWGSRNLDDARVGPGYCTAMAILALTVEYRLLPIYQRFEEPSERSRPDR